MLTPEDIGRIRAELTLGDTIAARKDAGGDDTESGLRALYRRARKLGIVGDGVAFEDFLDLVRVEDLKALVAEEVVAPFGSAPATSLPSAASGA